MENNQKIFYIVILILCCFIFLQTCSIKRNNNRELKQINNKIDSINNVIINKAEYQELIEQTIAWETLRIEEVSDKEHISVNALKQKTINNK